KSQAGAESIHQLRNGKLDRATLDRLAPVLELDSKALAELAEGRFCPNEIELDGLAQFNTPYDGMQVKDYLVWDPATKHAGAFDSGADCSPILKRAKKLGLTIDLILLTHAHPDHVADLSRLTKETGAPIYLSSREQAPGAQGLEEGKTFSVGNLEIESRL